MQLVWRETKLNAFPNCKLIITKVNYLSTDFFQRMVYREICIVVTINFTIFVGYKRLTRFFISYNIFIMSQLKVFISYSSLDKSLAGLFKQCFENYAGFSVFLAHEDISPALDWELKIIKEFL